MFDFWKRKRDDTDPLTSLKTVSRWLQHLPVGDIYAAQEKVVRELLRFNRGEGPASKERLHVLMALDEKSRDMHALLCAQYLRNPRMSKTIEAKLWTLIHAFYWEITRGYHAFIMDFVANPGGHKLQSMIPKVVARAIRGFAHILKWRHFRYESSEEKLWLRLHNLYRIAEFDGFSNLRLKAYDSDRNETTCEQEYGQALLLSLLANGSLLPRQLEIMDHWLDNWAQKIRIDREYHPEHHSFHVNTLEGTGPRRIRNPENNEAHRFISTRELLIQIDHVKQRLKDGETPALLGLSEDFRLPEGYTLLEHAQMQWAPISARERRRAQREETNGAWQVLQGFALIWEAIEEDQRITQGGGSAPLTPEEILDIKLYGFITERTRLARAERTVSDRRYENWEAIDCSESGIGFDIAQRDYDWLRIGKLLGLRPNNGIPWRVGALRRIVRTPEGGRLVGVGLFRGDLQAVTLEHPSGAVELQYVVEGYIVDELDPPAGQSQSFRAILLHDDAQTESLILESAHYAHGRRYILRAGGQNLDIALDAALDRGDVWLRCCFRVLSA